MNSPHSTRSSGCCRTFCIPARRAAILTFHSGEDRRVKKSFRPASAAGCSPPSAIRVITASPHERHLNPRSSPANSAGQPARDPHHPCHTFPPHGMFFSSWPDFQNFPPRREFHPLSQSGVRPCDPSTEQSEINENCIYTLSTLVIASSLAFAQDKPADPAKVAPARKRPTMTPEESFKKRRQLRRLPQPRWMQSQPAVPKGSAEAERFQKGRQGFRQEGDPRRIQSRASDTPLRRW